MTTGIQVKVTTASVRECVMYANLLLRGENTNQIGTALTVAISNEFDRWLAKVKLDAYEDGYNQAEWNRQMEDDLEIRD